MKRLFLALAIWAASAQGWAALTTDTVSNAVASCRVTTKTAISETLAPVEPWALEEVRLTLAAASASVVTIGLDSKHGSAFDATITTGSVYGTSFRYQPARPILFGNGDGMTVSFPNAGSTTASLEIIWAKR